MRVSRKWWVVNLHTVTPGTLRCLEWCWYWERESYWVEAGVGPWGGGWEGGGREQRTEFVDRVKVRKE